jgi:site-specific recombinase XerD
MDLKAIQELLGRSWLSTTTRYIRACRAYRARVDATNADIDPAWPEKGER